MKKIFCLIILCFTVLSVRSQSGEGYDPINPSDPQTMYRLELKASPQEGGYVTPSGHSFYRPGDWAYCVATPKRGYEFKCWMIGDSIISYHKEFNYTIPTSNEVLTAYFDRSNTYNPENPGDPSVDATQHRVRAYSKPSAGGTFNKSDFYVEEGGAYYIYAYPAVNYRFDCWLCNGEVVSRENKLTAKMGDADIEFVAQFVYDPVSPSDPGANYFNAETGEVIVDNFQAGDLASVIKNLVGYDRYDKVTSIIVAGKMESYDIGFHYSFDNCILLDLSRTTGCEELPFYAYSYMAYLEKVILPASIKLIDEYAFYDCSSLNELHCYAMTPPLLKPEALYGVDTDALVVQVPAEALALYQRADVWKNLTILPFDGETRSLTINLPAEANGGRYRNMYLELSNMVSGQVYRYVVTDRLSYSFNNIINNTAWSIKLHNERGDVFGSLYNIEIGEEDVVVNFDNLLTPCNVALKVVTPTGEDVTDRVQVAWSDKIDNYLSGDAQLRGLPAGMELKCSVTLNKELAMQYLAPDAIQCTVSYDSPTVVCTLNPIPQVLVSGVVRDSLNNSFISGATITFSQSFAGKYSKTVIVNSDAQGRYRAVMYNVPTTMTVAMQDYISRTMACEFTSGVESVTLPEVVLKPIKGAVVLLNFTYTASTVKGETEQVQDWYSDYNNIDYALYNVTKQRAITEYNVQYPQIVLLDEVDEGDELCLTATSRNGMFMPVETYATVQEQQVPVVFDIVELGKIQSTFVSNANKAVVGSLYNANGRLINTYNYTQASLTISNLADGTYTLVSMGSSPFYNSIYNLSQLPETGLKEGIDYVVNTIEVKSGEVSVIEIESVPILDESKLYYTGEKTSFAVNKTNITAGNYLTLTANIDFKEAYKSSVGDVQVLIDLPEHCAFVENSVMVGNAIGGYELEGNRLTIPLRQYTDRVRFCVIPTLSGIYTPSAFVQFSFNGSSILQPIGQVSYTVKDLSISVPAVISKPEMHINGTAPAKALVEIYNNDLKIAETTTLSNGVWTAVCQLDDPYNMSTHNIYAKVTTPQGLVLQSESQECVYDMYMVEPKTVTMTFYGGGVGNEIVFDLQKASVNNRSYTYVSATDFTFVIDLTNNDPEIVQGVDLRVYTNKNRWITLEASYNAKKNRWVAVEYFDNKELPAGVAVDIYVDKDPVLDADVLHSALQHTQSKQAEFEADQDALEVLLDKMLAMVDDPEADNDSIIALINEIEMMSGSNNFNPASTIDDAQTDAELEAFLAECDAVMSEMSITSLDNIINSNIYDMEAMSEFLDGMEIYTCDGLEDDELESLGYMRMAKTDSTAVYFFMSDMSYEMIDFASNMHVIVPQNSELYAPLRAVLLGEGGVEASLARLEALCERLKSMIMLVVDLVATVEDILQDQNKFLDQKIEDAFERLWFHRTNRDFIVSKILYAKLKVEIKLMQMTRLANNKVLKWLSENIKSFRVGKVMGKCFTLFSLVMNIRDGIQSLKYVAKLQDKCLPCPDDEQNAINIQKSLIRLADVTRTFYVAQVLSDIASLLSIKVGIAASIPSGGTSLAAVGVAVGIVVANFIACEAHSRYFDAKVALSREQIAALECNKDDDDDDDRDDDDNDDKNKPPYPVVEPIIDPAGYVYEGVTSNRVEGVKATIYYKEMVEDMYGVQQEKIMLWDAEAYAQENPLFTDKDGMYRWDVPQGLWQVKFEKEGYETTYSEWLPVPPPQLDVNVAIKQLRQPEVKMANAYEDAVEVTFDKYMQPELLTTDNIVVMLDDQPVEGSIALLDAEESLEGETFASKVRFNAAEPFNATEVTLMVNNRVKSYAGVAMQSNFMQTFGIELEVRNIACDSISTINSGETVFETVYVQPAKAAAGKTLLVKSSSVMLLTTDADSYVVGDDGRVDIQVTGELPGTAMLTYTIDGMDIEGRTLFNIVELAADECAAPIASIASGSEVERGTELYLTCSTPNATIYYTLDGSCPCDVATRILYDGTPIIISDNVVVKAMAVSADMVESEIVEYYYTVRLYDGVEGVNDDNAICVYPVPTRQVLNISAGNATMRYVQLTSINGTPVYAQEVDTEKLTIDVSALPTGMYMLNIVTDKRVYSRKITIVE